MKIRLFYILPLLYLFISCSQPSNYNDNKIINSKKNELNIDSMRFFSFEDIGFNKEKWNSPVMENEEKFFIVIMRAFSLCGTTIFIDKYKDSISEYVAFYQIDSNSINPLLLRNKLNPKFEFVFNSTKYTSDLFNHNYISKAISDSLTNSLLTLSTDEQVCGLEGCDIHILIKQYNKVNKNYFIGDISQQPKFKRVVIAILNKIKVGKIKFQFI